MQKLDFEKEGLQITVSSPELQFKNGKAVCKRCGTAEIPLGNAHLTETAPSQAHLPALELVKNGREANAIINKAPRNNLLKFLREFAKYEKIRQKGASDEEIFPFILACPNCHSEFTLTTTIRTDVLIQNPIDLRTALKTIPMVKDGFTLKALARIAVVQKYKSPEAYIENIENVLADIAKADSYLQRLHDLVTDGKKLFKSGVLGELVSVLEADFAIIPEQVQRNVNKELDDRAKELLEQAFVKFEDEESLPEKIGNAVEKMGNKLTGQDAVLAA